MTCITAIWYVCVGDAVTCVVNATQIWPPHLNSSDTICFLPSSLLIGKQRHRNEPLRSLPPPPIFLALLIKYWYDTWFFLLITENGGISSSELVFVAFSNAHIGNRLWWKAELVKDEEMYMHIWKNISCMDKYKWLWYPMQVEDAWC